MAAAGLDSYFKGLVKVLGIGAAFASLPLFVSLASLQPPWPPALGFVSAAMVMLGALVIWEWTRKSRVRQRRRTIAAAATVTVVGLFAYLVLYSFFVEQIPGTTDRVVRGYACTPDARLVYKEACPDLPAEALRDAEGQSLTLWTRTSITTIRMLLTFTWLLFTAGLIMAVGAVVAGRKFE